VQKHYITVDLQTVNRWIIDSKRIKEIQRIQWNEGLFLEVKGLQKVGIKAHLNE